MININQGEVSLSTILRTTGIINKTVGKAITKLIKKLFIQIKKKPGTMPTFINVKINERDKDINNDMTSANKRVEYFLSIFILKRYYRQF